MTQKSANWFVSVSNTTCVLLVPDFALSHVTRGCPISPPGSQVLNLRLNYYQYVRPIDKLLSVKRAFLRTKRRKARAENAFAALILIGCRDVKQLHSANEILRIPFQCQSWREFCGWNLFALFFPLNSCSCLADRIEATTFHIIVSCYISVKQFFLIKWIWIRSICLVYW